MKINTAHITGIVSVYTIRMPSLSSPLDNSACIAPWYASTTAHAHIAVCDSKCGVYNTGSQHT